MALPPPTKVGTPSSSAHPTQMRIIDGPTKLVPKAMPVEPIRVSGPTSLGTPSVKFTGFVATIDDVLAIIPDINPSYIDHIIKKLAMISNTNFRQSLHTIGLAEQEKLAELPEKINNLVPKNGVIDQSLETLQVVRDLVMSIQIKKDESLLGKMFGKAQDRDALKQSVKNATNKLKANIPNLDVLSGRITEIRKELELCKIELSHYHNMLKIMCSKANGADDVINSRSTSLHITMTVAEQTNQLIGLKFKNVDAIIATIRETLLNSIPSWFNQMEILEQMEISNAIDTSLVESLLKNQDDIVKQLSQFSTKG